MKYYTFVDKDRVIVDVAHNFSEDIKEWNIHTSARNWPVYINMFNFKEQ